jgi:hypothetical protein
LYHCSIAFMLREALGIEPFSHIKSTRFSSVQNASPVVPGTLLGESFNKKAGF